MNQKDLPSSVRRPLDQHAEEATQRGLSRLNALLEHADPIELFVATASSVMFTTPEKLIQANNSTASVKIERLAYELYPHFGRSRFVGDREALESTTLRLGDIEACHEILDDLFFGYMFQMHMHHEPQEDHLVASLRGRTAIVRGNAYPPQTERRIREVLGRFDQWYSQQIGIAPTRAVETLRAIIRDKENAFNDAVRPVARQASDLYDSKWQAIRRKHNYRRDAEECTFIEQFRTRATARIAGFNLGSARPSFLHIPAYPPRLVPPITDIEWNGLILS